MTRHILHRNFPCHPAHHIRVADEATFRRTCPTCHTRYDVAVVADDYATGRVGRLVERCEWTELVSA